MFFAIAVIFGALIGSFLNVIILRLPQGESIVLPASHCPECRTPLHWYENIPVLSFLVLRGRCRNCRVRISWQYPLVESAMAFLSYVIYLLVGATPPFLIYFIFCAALLVIIFIDFYHQIIPDVISLPGIILGFAASFINPLLSWQDAGLGIIIGGGIFCLIAGGYYLITKRAGMGGGDIKLLAMIGAFLGWQSLPFVIFVSALMGSVVGIFAMVEQKKGGKTVIPYGPFLAVASISYIIFQSDILYFMSHYYLR